MKVIKLTETNEFRPEAMKRYFLVETSEYFKIINFNLDAGVTFPVNSHDMDGDLSLQVLEGKGWLLGEGNTKIPTQAGDILVSEIREPHGVRPDPAVPGHGTACRRRAEAFSPPLTRLAGKRSEAWATSVVISLNILDRYQPRWERFFTALP